MGVCLAGAGRIVDFAKRPDASHSSYGESVGFFRLSGDIAGSLALRAHAAVHGGGRDLEYEEPIRALIREDAARASEMGAPGADGETTGRETTGGAMFGWEDITGLPWTEIDDMDDVAKAEQLLPLIDGPSIDGPSIHGAAA